MNSGVPKSLAPSLPVRPGWSGGPPTNRAPPSAPRPTGPPQHPMQSYQQQPPQPLMAQHIPPPVNMPTSGHHVPGILPPTAGPMPLMVAQPTPIHPVLDELRGKNNYNPIDFDLTAPNARFVIQFLLLDLVKVNIYFFNLGTKNSNLVAAYFIFIYQRAKFSYIIEM